MDRFRAHCAYCRKEVDLEDCVRTPAFHYCNYACKRAGERAYDEYVDPLGWYSNPNRIDNHD